MTQRQNKYPSELFVRFVARNYYDAPYRPDVRFLDLGCGAGAQMRFLRQEGFTVDGLDWITMAPDVMVGDLREWEYPADTYDCVLDHNTLCHVENPPYDKIHRTLKPGGKFFCVTPAFGTWQATLEGKGYVTTATAFSMRRTLSMFSEVQIGKAEYPDRGHQIKSLVCEATK